VPSGTASTDHRKVVSIREARASDPPLETMQMVQGGAPPRPHQDYILVPSDDDWRMNSGLRSTDLDVEIKPQVKPTKSVTIVTYD
jgi:hypothetical protein